MQKLTCLSPLPPTAPLGSRWKSQADVVLCCASPLPRQVRERLQLEARLVKSRRRGALLQPLDVAGVTEQVVLQRVAAVTVFVIELQTAVLGGGKKVQRWQNSTEGWQG